MSNNFPSYPSNNGSNGDNPYNPYNDTAQNGQGYGQNAQGYGQGTQYNDNNYAGGGYGNAQYGNAGTHNAAQQGYGAFPTNDYGQAPMHGSFRPGVGKRFLGYLIDSILAGIVIGLLTFLIFRNDIMDFVDATMNSPETAASLPLSVTAGSGVISIVLWFAYRIGMETSTGATLGKMAVGARVTMEDGSPVTAQASFLRNSWYLLSLVLNMVPFLGWLLQLAVLVAVGVTIGNDNGNQSFSDKWGKTIVVDKN